MRVAARIFDPARGPADIIETHISTVAFDGDVADKRKKGVRFAFVDLSTPERREAICRREFELNSRFSPDVYLGVEEVVDDEGVVVDHAVRDAAYAGRAEALHLGAQQDGCAWLRSTDCSPHGSRTCPGCNECRDRLGGDTGFAPPPLGAEPRGARAVRAGTTRSPLARRDRSARRSISQRPYQAARGAHPK